MKTPNSPFFFQAYLLRSEYVGPYFVLGHPLEALVYSQMRLNVHVAQDEDIEKLEFIASLIKNKTDDFFKVILVSNGEKALAVQDWLMKNDGIEAYVITEDVSSVEAEGIVENWYILQTKA